MAKAMSEVAKHPFQLSQFTYTAVAQPHTPFSPLMKMKVRYTKFSGGSLVGRRWEALR